MGLALGEVSTLTINLSDAVSGTSGFKLFADGSEVTLSNPQPGGTSIKFETGVVYAGQSLSLTYAPGDVSSDETSCPLLTLSLVVANNSTVYALGPTSNIHLSSNADPSTYDGFRLYLDGALPPNHAWEGKAIKIPFSALTGPISDGQHSLRATTYNVVGESPVSGEVSFLYAN